MNNHATMSKEQLFFAVFCIESLADDLGISGEKVYRMLTENSDILDNYIIPCYDALHTQGKGYIVDELKRLLHDRGLLP